MIKSWFSFYEICENLSILLSENLFIDVTEEM